MNPLEPIRRRLTEFVGDARASVTVELVLVVPLLIWAYFATMIFSDAYRARTQAQAAALHVADLISRHADRPVTEAYFEGMNDVYDFLIAGAETSRLRITAVMWDRVADEPLVLWSHGTRGMNPLPANAFQLMIADDLATLREIMDGTEHDDLIAGFTQMPNSDLHNRIPPVMPGETLILVESFTMWESPLNAVFLGFNILEDTRLSPIAVTRPRFAPFLNFEGADNIYPPDASEFGGTPVDPVSDPDPGATDPAAPVDPVDPVNIVSVTDFSAGVNSGWSSTTTTSARGSNAVGSSFLGPFGQETRTRPVTFSHGFNQTMARADYAFELVLFDTWDGYNQRWSPPQGETMAITVNGEVVALEAFQRNPSGIYARARQGAVHTEHGHVHVSFDLVDSSRDINGSRGPDQIWTLAIRIDDPAPSIEIGFIGNLSENIRNESFGFGGMSLTAVPGQHDPARWVPDRNTRNGSDSLTGFALHEGCGVAENPAQTLTLGNSDLRRGAIRMARNVGGSTALRQCGDSRVGYFGASPLLILDYVNDQSNGNNNRFRIRTDDGRNGRACDPVFLMRDPSGQIHHVDDLNGFGWNAGLELAHAQTGTYVIWAGRYSRGSCQTNIVFEHY